MCVLLHLTKNSETTGFKLLIKKFHKMIYDLKGHSRSHKVTFLLKNSLSLDIFFVRNLIVSKTEINASL